ncbi:MAG: cysteine desulfurase-like protein [Bacteroidales bacterium]|nr:MAG: cysteine desulfurase-like protein [Bacteroidales bacterium]
MDISFVRNQFPALSNNFTFMDNAGGSQVLGTVIDRIREYFLNYNVQLGASYEVSANAGKKLSDVSEKLATFINAKSPKEIIIGHSSTLLLRILSICISKNWKSGDEVIVTNSEHEANVSCWNDLKEKGIIVKIWKVNPQTLEFELEQLSKLLSSKTKLVAMVHASNILGTINPIREVAKLVHDTGAYLCVDGVAYAPHRLVDVQMFDVDFYVFSTYKTFGPHMGIMYGRLNLLREMDGFNHYFITKEDVPYKFQPGNFNFELTYSLQAIPEYIELIHDYHYVNDKAIPIREKYQKSYDLIASQEQELAAKLLDYLNTKKEVHIIGCRNGAKDKRVPTISFIHNKYKSSEIVEKVDAYNIGIRYGDFYAKKIIEDTELIQKDGVVRVSLVHYNTLEEVGALINAFEKFL